jgi:hypothetical protein
MRRKLTLVLTATLLGCAESPPPQPQYQPPPPVVAQPIPQQQYYPPPQEAQGPPPNQVQLAQYSEQNPAPPEADVDEDYYDENQPPPPSETVDQYPVGQPEAIAAPAAPPPYIEEDPGYAPWDGALWINGFWRWRGEWIWVRGRWALPPQPGFIFCEP